MNSFIYLDEDDMIKAGVLDMPKCIDAMTDMFSLLQKEDYRMGGENANEHGIRVSFPKTTDIEGMPVHEPDRRFMAMPAYLGGRFHMFGIKSYGSNWRNADKGLPRSVLMMQLLDVETGLPLAYMSANLLSAMRTAATTGIGVKYLAPKKCETVAIIGPGVMSRFAMDSFMAVLDGVKTVKIKGRGTKNINRFIDHCKTLYPQIKEYIVCDSIKEACKEADLVYFGTTNAAKFEDNPHIEGDWIKKGALVISASALLVDTDFISSRCKLISDNYKMYEGWGQGQPKPTQKHVSTLLGMGFYDAVCEGKISRADITDLGEVINGIKTGRDSEDQIILYAVGGMPVEDVSWAYDIYQNALAKKIGVSLKLWDTPELMK